MKPIEFALSFVLIISHPHAMADNGLKGRSCFTDQANFWSPDDIKTHGPLSSLKPVKIPKNIKPPTNIIIDGVNYSGIWRGYWEGTLDSAIIPLSIDKNKMTACYVWGTNLLVRSGGAMIIEGLVSGKGIIFPVNKGSSINLINLKDGSFLGLYYDKILDKPYRSIFNRYCSLESKHPRNDGC